MATYGISHGFEHVQTTPSTVWTITHKLNTETPIVDCWCIENGEKVKILPQSVVATSPSVVTVTFSIPRAGWAFVV